MIRLIWKTLRSLAEFWCYAMHPDPRWPIHGYYECPRCYRRYRVPWEPPAITNGTVGVDDAVHVKVIPSPDSEQEFAISGRSIRST